MKIQQIRNATLRIEYAGKTFLTDPWLMDKGAMGTFRALGNVFRCEPDKGFISMESPLGKAVLGAAVGDHRMVRVSDDYSYEVVIQSIENAEDDGSAPLLPY